MAETYTVTPLDVGRLWLGKDHVLGDEYGADDRIEFALISFLIRGNGRNVLVDLGPKTLDYCNQMFRQWGFFRTLPDGSTPDDIVQEHGNVFDGLRREDLSPEDITDIIFTHLHADHHGMDDASDGGACEDFPNATFHISRRGWDFNVAKRVDGHWNSYLDWGFGDCMLRKAAEGRMIAHDDAEIASGLSTIYLGGHSECSQGVRVETKDGPLIIGSDDFYQYELMESGTIARLVTTRERMVESNARLADWALNEGAIIVPVHDPAVVRLYHTCGDGWLRGARVLSLSAARGFRQSHPPQTA